MFLKFRCRLGFESLCAEVSDSITRRRFCRIPIDGKVPHATTLMKLTGRCGSAAVGGLNEALLARAAEARLLRTSRLRADTTVVPANVCYPADPGCRGGDADPGAGPQPLGREARACDRVQAGAARRAAPRGSAGHGGAGHRGTGRPG